MTQQALHTWTSIAVLVVASTSADVIMSRTMKHIGDLGQLWRKRGLAAVIKRVAASRGLLAAIAFMALGFFTLLFALSWADVSLVVPAAASLGFMSNALAAKLILREAVTPRRWAAALLACGGVALLAH
jgi:drug/metabolite transporter (DMT)-like permease